tara:strand:+ start:90 stop:407 length:318 start_codon:yes stop_codon:yes gene_type:complete
MAHFAKLENNVVVQVIVAEPGFFDTFIDTSPGYWLETSYDGSIRKNYAGIGYKYDQGRDAFIPPKPYPSWVLNEDTCLWDAPTAMPDDEQMYTWNEATQAWDVDG